MNPLSNSRVMQCDEPETKAQEVGTTVSGLRCIGVSNRHKSATHHGHRVFLCKVRAQLFLQGNGEGGGGGEGESHEFIKVKVKGKAEGKRKGGDERAFNFRTPFLVGSGANTYSMRPEFLKQPLHQPRLAHGR